MVGDVCDNGVAVFVIIGEGAGPCSNPVDGGPGWCGKEEVLVRDGSFRRRRSFMPLFVLFRGPLPSQWSIYVCVPSLKSYFDHCCEIF